MNARLNKFIFSNEQPTTKRMILCAIFYACIMIICIYTYPSFLAYFDNDRVTPKMAMASLDVQVKKLLESHRALEDELEIYEVKTKMLESIIITYKDKLNVRPIIEKHIINVNHLIFPQLASIISNGIIEAEKAYPNISYDIILAVMELESTFKYTAKSNKDCIGLMQVNPAVWTDELIKAEIITKKGDLYDPTKNILAGTYILNTYYEQVESDDVKAKWEGALSKYFGAQSKEYFDKFQKFFGNFHLIMASSNK